MTMADRRAELDIGSVVQRTFRVLGRNAVPFGGLALLLIGLPAIILGLINLNATATAAFSPTALLASLAMNLLNIFLSVMLQVCVVIASVADMKGQRLPFVDVLRQAVKFVLPVLGITLLMVLGITLASFLLFVPGMILATMWAVAVPAAVMEKTGVFGAFRRSNDLTRGNRWRIFGLYAIFFAVIFIIELVILAMGGFSLASMARAKTTFPLGFLLIATALGLVTSLIGSVGVACIYFELRAAGEGVDVDDLAAVFA